MGRNTEKTALLSVIGDPRAFTGRHTGGKNESSQTHTAALAADEKQHTEEENTKDDPQC